MQRQQLDLIRDLNARKLERDVYHPEIEGAIESFELAFHMQDEIPSLLDLSSETESTLKLYGVGTGQPTDRFGRQCLLARRMAEAGVRFVELTAPVNWDVLSDRPWLTTRASSRGSRARSSQRRRALARPYSDRPWLTARASSWGSVGAASRKEVVSSNALTTSDALVTTLTGGDTVGNGGAISNSENLTITASTISGNAARFGGGIINSEQLTL